jgi:Leucine-rich repeat (LRR) protein
VRHYFLKAISCIFIWAMFSCQIPPDIPPFVITTTVLDNGNSVRVDWPLVNDSRLGTVRYDVFLGNSQLASNITANTFTINNLAFNTTYTGTLVGKASTGDTESMDFTFTTGKEYILIPDAGFEQALITGGQDTEGILNGKMIKADAEAATKIDASGYNISNTSGLQYFINLIEADFSNNKLKTIDFGQNRAIRKLNLGKNEFTNLNFSPNTSLVELYVFNNLLNQLNITQCVNLEVLVADNNKLAALDINSLNKLKAIGLSFNSLSNISISAKSQLESLDLSSNPYSTINISTLGNLEDFVCKACQLSTLNTSSNSKLRLLNVSGNKLTSVNLASNLLLKTIDVSNNRLTALSVKPLTSLIYLNTQNNTNLLNICVPNVTTATDNFDWVKDLQTNYISNCN